jgi:hypothetical protein
MTVAELAAYVATRLRDRGIEVVLTGGSCVTIYSGGKYVSADLDFVETRFATRRDIRAAMAEIGFSERDRYFLHPGTITLVEFPPGPLAIGKEPVKRIDTMELPTGRLLIISPTDCVKDRLAAYHHWKDLQCLEQAVMVAVARSVDVDEIERWSVSEGMAERFRDFTRKLRGG